MLESPRLNIYLIDDDLEDQEIFEMALEETGINANLCCFSNVSTGIEQLTSFEKKPEFLFLDLNMPKINGLECLKMLSELSFKNSIKVIIYSTSSNINDINKTKALGAHDYLIKPVNFNGLVESLTNILSVAN